MIVSDIAVVQLGVALENFSKAASMPGGPSLAMQRHDPTWAAWKALCEANSELIKRR